MMVHNGFEQDQGMNTADQLQEIYNQGKYSEIIELFEKKENSYLTNDANAQMILAAANFKLDRFSYCLQILENIEGVFSNDPHFFSLYGASYRRMGLTQEALKKFQIAINLSNNSDHRILNNYANLLLDTDQTDEAVLIWEKILKDDPSYEDAKINLEKARLKVNSELENEENNSYQETIESLSDPLLAAFSEEEVKDDAARKKIHKHKIPSEIQQLMPQHTDIKQLVLEKDNLLQKCLSERNYNMGLKLTAELRDLGLPESLVYKYASDCFIGLKNFKDAEINLLHSLLLEPESTNSLVNLLSLCTMKGDFKRAEVIFEKLCKKNDIDKNHLKTLRHSLQSHKNKQGEKKYLFVN